MSAPHDDEVAFRQLAAAAIEAGRAIMAVREAGFAVRAKADASPVTEADHRAEAILEAAIMRVAPGVPIVAEEAIAGGHLPAVGDTFFLVDALDGTKDFIGGGSDFTVNVGLVRRGEPVAGVVYAPAAGRLWLATCGKAMAGPDLGRLAAIHVRPPDPAQPSIVASRSHRTGETDAFIARFPGSCVVAAGSSMKFAAIAEGEADLYPRLGPTSQWDTAAGDAVLRAAGGKVLTMAGRPLPYGPAPGRVGAEAFLNPWFVATGGLDPFASRVGRRP